MKKAIRWTIVALILFALLDIFLSWLFTGLADPGRPRPAYTIESSRERGAFIAPVTVTPDVIHWHGERIAIKEAWLEKRMELDSISVFIPFVLEHHEYRPINGYNLCLNLSEGWDTMWKLEKDVMFVVEGKGNSFGTLGRAVLWEELDSPDFDRMKVLVTDNFKFEGAQSIEIKSAPR